MPSQSMLIFLSFCPSIEIVFHTWWVSFHLPSKRRDNGQIQWNHLRGHYFLAFIVLSSYLGFSQLSENIITAQGKQWDLLIKNKSSRRNNTNIIPVYKKGKPVILVVECLIYFEWASQGLVISVDINLEGSTLESAGYFFFNPKSIFLGYPW